MSDGDEDTEIVFIRKRHGDDDESHHGGVWKLAFADFMTAMMAFFLVMWLINSTSKESKAAIVQYFNPVQLLDSSPAHKGLRDPQEGGLGKSVQNSATDDKPGQSKDNKDGPSREAALLYDPITTLDNIAGGAGALDAGTSATKSGQEAPAFGDPFDRSVRGRGYVDARVTEDNRSPDNATPLDQLDEPRPKPAPTTPKGAAFQQQKQSVPALEEKQKPEQSSTALRATVDKIVKTEVAGAKGAPLAEVSETPEGLLISLTDDTNFSMFAVGSVEPKPQLVRIIGQIGRVLAKQPGEIEIRGHTDGRSYKSATYDNWRLSSDRANMAYYMLVRGGLVDKRIVKISGFADRRLKVQKDPLAAVNRRIEILLRRSER